MDNIQSNAEQRRPMIDERFVALFAQAQPAIFGYILSLVPHWSDAEDVMQQVSVTLWRKFDEFDPDAPGSSFVRWACVVAKHAVLNHLKKARRSRLVFSDDLIELMAAEGEQDVELLAQERRALAGCLQKLSKRQRQVLEACYGRSATVKQLAEALGRTPNSLYKMLGRIRDGLLQCVERTLTAGGEA